MTGLDVPNLVGGALGRGFGEKLRTGEGNGESTGGSATDRITEIAGEGLTTLNAAQEAAKANAVPDAAAAKASANEGASNGAVEAVRVKESAEKASRALWPRAPASA